jgi:hypothetical protein
MEWASLDGFFNSSVVVDELDSAGISCFVAYFVALIGPGAVRTETAGRFGCWSTIQFQNSSIPDPHKKALLIKGDGFIESRRRERDTSLVGIGREKELFNYILACWLAGRFGGWSNSISVRFQIRTRRLC